MSRMINCIKLGQELEGLDYKPVPGELGEKIWNNVSKVAWGEWLKQQTMIINENRLNLTEDSARKYLRQQMEYYFFGGAN
jgi:Fe-S cluster biosynthesis and repair protein YggX